MVGVLAAVMLAILAVEGMCGPADNTLIVARSKPIVSLDINEDVSSTEAIVINIAEPLVGLTPEMDLEPLLATSWEFVEPTRLRLYLRRDVEFHDGTAFNADAVKFTYDRALFAAKPAVWVGLGAQVISGVEVVDTYTVDILTKEPFGALLQVVSMCYMGIVSPAAVAKYGAEYNRHPVGTGPFKFESWPTSDEVRLVANERYWRTRASLDRVVFRVIPEASSRMLALRAGEVDVVLDPSQADIPAIRSEGKLAIVATQSTRTLALHFMVDRAPFDDIRVRHAVAHAIDHSAIVDEVLEGLVGMPTTSSMAPGVFGFYGRDIEEVYAYDPGRAKQLLADAGWKDTDADGVLERGGVEFEVSFLPIKDRVMGDLDTALAVAAMLGEVGIRCKIETFDLATYYTKTRSADIPYNLITSSWGTTTGDADYTLYARFRSSALGGFPPTGWNISHYENADVDRMLLAAQKETDQVRRAALYAQIESILATELPYVCLFVNLTTAVTSSSVKGLKMHPIDYNVLYYPVSFGAVG
jgi:peptide/nickel transport system substrate-binding protein